MSGNRHDNIYDSMIETVEDWNEEELKRKQQLTAEMEEDLPSDTDRAAVPAEETENPDQDAFAELTVKEDKMSATVFVHPPKGAGLDIAKEDVIRELNAQGVVYGVHMDKIDEIVEQRLYRQLFTIAEGKPSVDGKNGRIKDYFPRKHQLKFAQKENGGIDFKSMNLIHNVKPGEVVCEVTPPEEGEDGVDVFGQTVPGKRGQMPPVPQGKNIVFSPEKDKLLTACEGNLTFRNGRFHVENVYEVAENVDNSVGNIDFSGSVHVHGDVFEGYRVRAKGDITIDGVAEGAELEAGGSIILQKGVRGMKTGILRAKGDITGKFLEDCTIHAGGNVQAEYIINSRVSCEKDVILIGKRGAFIGGTCAVYHTMKVKAVGAMSHIPTEVILGVTPDLLEQIEKTRQEMNDMTKKLMECRKNISYLSDKERAGTLTESQVQKLKELKIQEPVNQMIMRQLKTKMDGMKKQLKEVGKSRLIADTVHAGTSISIGDAKLNIQRQEDHCSYYLLDGEIKRGMF